MGILGDHARYTPTLRCLLWDRGAELQPLVVRLAVAEQEEESLEACRGNGKTVRSSVAARYLPVDQPSVMKRSAGLLKQAVEPLEQVSVADFVPACLCGRIRVSDA